MTSTMPAFFLLFLHFCYFPLLLGHVRGPHHPRSSPRVDRPPSSNVPDHKHYVPRGGPGGEPAPVLTHDKNLLHDKEHIKEDLGDWVMPDGKEMTAEEMEFHYFKMHDFDNNSMLDGLEILQALSHIMPEDNLGNVNPSGSGTSSSGGKITEAQQLKEDFDYVVELIDRVLEEDDIDKDGYLSYFEYVVGRRRDEKREKALRSSNSIP